MQIEKHGFEVLQGKGTFSGKLLGGCLEVLNILAISVAVIPLFANSKISFVIFLYFPILL